VRCVVYRGVGGPEVVAVEERPDPRPAKREVLIAPGFAGVNPADVLQREGRHPVPAGWPADVPGLEVAGRVLACGTGVHSWKAGDRVFGVVGGGGLADRVLAHERLLAPVPDALDGPAAAAVPEGFITAHDAIFTRARLAPGETLLVNGANGGVGTAAVQLGLAAGARVLARVRTAELGEQLRALGAEPLVAAPAPADSVDVVLELVGAPHLEEAMTAIATGGRLMVIGAGAGSQVELSLRVLMTKRASLMASTLRSRPLEQKAAAVQAFAHQVVPLLARGAVRPLVDRVFPAEQAAEAFEYLARPGKLGKVLLRFDG
jgi:NADPH:quinone reductase-like Zn-dependent oxidoreductase